MIKTENFKKVEVTSADELHLWMEENHRQRHSIWLVTYKKEVRDKYVSVHEILDEILCYGWIDGVRRKLDDKRTMQLLSPRKAQHWAKTYKDRAAKLIEEGRMRPAGFKSIEESKRNGLWNFMDEVDQLIKPEDLVKALADRPGAADFFDNINDSSKRFALRWIKLAKTAGTRARRVEKIAHLAAREQKLPGS